MLYMLTTMLIFCAHNNRKQNTILQLFCSVSPLKSLRTIKLACNSFLFIIFVIHFSSAIQWRCENIKMYRELSLSNPNINVLTKLSAIKWRHKQDWHEGHRQKFSRFIGTATSTLKMPVWFKHYFIHKCIIYIYLYMKWRRFGKY